MSILQKDYEIIVDQGSPGSIATYAKLPVPGHWETKKIRDAGVRGVTANATKRFATWAELRRMWPTISYLVNDKSTWCPMKIKILTTIRRTEFMGKPMYILGTNLYIAVSTIYWPDPSGIDLIYGVGILVISENPKNYTLEPNPQYHAGYHYGGELAGCPI